MIASGCSDPAAEAANSGSAVAVVVIVARNRISTSRQSAIFTSLIVPLILEGESHLKSK
jgi:hypothetical protein